MGWKLTKIPKILHVYWGGGVMHYLRYSTVTTFMKHNPDWEIMFWYPEYPNKNISWVDMEQKYDVSQCTDFTSELMSLPITKIPVDFTHHGFSNDLSEVHKSDYLRLWLLHTYGGVWSDMDIFYIKPMNDFHLNKWNNNHIETFYCDNEYGHSAGFLMGSKDNAYFKKLEELSRMSFDSRRYQSIGVYLYNRYFRTPQSIRALTPAINMPMSVVYPYVAGNEEVIIKGKENRIKEETIGVHWFAGHPAWQEFLIKTDGGQNNLPDTVIGNLLKNNKMK